MSFSYVLAALVQWPAAPALPADSVRELQRRARRAEARYEQLARRLAPLSFASGAGTTCDEIVGRFCLRFDSVIPNPEPRPEPLAVQEARAEAVAALRRYFAVAPAERAAAGPLVRLLIRDGRAREALSSAGAFAALSADSVWPPLLLGVAHHAAGEAAAAEAYFRAALARMESEERRRWLDLEWLVDPPEWKAVASLPAAERAEYERRFWLVADPFWLTAANEHWVEHAARHVEARLLEDVPLVAGMYRWGRDIEELTLRYGTPTERRRLPSSSAAVEAGMVEYWDTAQRAYAPARLRLQGLPPPALPGDRPPLYDYRARFGYALRVFTRVFELDHQASRFLHHGDIVVRVDATLRADSARTGSADAGLVVMDSTLTQRTERRARVPWRGDSVRVTLRAPVPAGPFIYSVEVLDTAADAAGRARYALAAWSPAGRPALSDLVVAAPFGPVTPRRHDDPALRPLTSLVVSRGDTVGLYAEAYGLARGAAAPVAVELSMERTDPRSLLGRVADWIGRATGILPPAADARVGWVASADGDLHTLALNLPLDPDRTGHQTLVLTITDPVTGRTARTSRTILIQSR